LTPPAYIVRFTGVTDITNPAAAADGDIVDRLVDAFAGRRPTVRAFSPTP